MRGLGIKSKSIQWAILTLVAILSIAGSCDSTGGRDYNPEQLFGSWRGITIEGEGELTFGVESGYYVYTFKALPGSFPERDIGDDILSQGIWGLNRSILTLIDDPTDAYYTCVVSDHFDLNLNAEATIMTMTYFGTECVERGQLLENAAWYKQIEVE